MYYTETKIGGFYNIGIQVFGKLKGVKVFAEAEFRGYGPLHLIIGQF